MLIARHLRTSVVNQAISLPKRLGQVSACRLVSTTVSLISIGSETVQVKWHDGGTSLLDPIWLRERCQSDITVDPATLQPRKSPHEIPKKLLVTEARLLEEGDQVQVSFSDGHVSQFSLADLQAEVTDFRTSPIQVPDYQKPQRRLWRGSTAKVPTFEYSALMQDESVRLALVEEVLVGGQVLVRGVPQDDGEVVRFGQMFSTLRDTNWGPVFNVRTKPDDAVKPTGSKPQMDLAYTPSFIGFHTDNPYRWPTPDFQLLHAIDHCECPDGAAPCAECQVMNYMVDGFDVAEQLRQEDPEAFRLLCEVPVRFEHNGGDNETALVHVAPHFELEETVQGQPSSLRAIRFSAKSGQYSPPLDLPTLRAFNRARRRFSELAHSEENVLSLQFKPGDLLFFDNQRLLHSRSEIAPTDGERWVQGCYIDRDGLWLNYERWRRRASPPVTNV